MASGREECKEAAKRYAQFLANRHIVGNDSEMSAEEIAQICNDFASRLKGLASTHSLPEAEVMKLWLEAATEEGWRDVTEGNFGLHLNA